MPLLKSFMTWDLSDRLYFPSFFYLSNLVHLEGHSLSLISQRIPVGEAQELCIFCCSITLWNILPLWSGRTLLVFHRYLVMCLSLRPQVCERPHFLAVLTNIDCNILLGYCPHVKFCTVMEICFKFILWLFTLQSNLMRKAAK